MADSGRRHFLGGAGLLAGLAVGCRPRRDPYSLEKPPVPVARGVRQGSESHVLSTCGLCPAACGIRVRVVDGRAVKIEGNVASPVNRGGLCARGQAGLQMLYHPDRIAGPLRRVGPRGKGGAGAWRSIAWSEALAELSGQLGNLRAAGHPESLLLLDGEATGTTHALWARFMDVFGSPNHVGHGATGFGAVAQVMGTMTGTTAMPGYDFERARCVLLVGSGPLESSPQWIHLARSLAGEFRPRLLLASPRLPQSGALVDGWFPVAPGRSAAFLLGLAHVLLREQLGDESMLEVAQGFAVGPAWPLGFREQVMANYAPAKVQGLTGIAATQMEGLARELVATRPSVVVLDEWANDSATVTAGVVLNALLSSLNAPGGMVLDSGPGLADLAPADFDGLSRAGRSAQRLDGGSAGRIDFASSRLLALPEALLAGKPYPTEVLLLSYANPAFSKPGANRWAQAIAKLPFVVSFSPILDESVLLADLVLPDHSFFERWDLVLPGRGTRALSLRQPVVSPLGQSMQTGEVILRLAAAMGGVMAKAFPWASYREAVTARLINLPGGAEAVLADLEDRGVWVAAHEVSAETVDTVPSPLLRVPAPQAPSPDGDSTPFPFILLPCRGPGYAEGGMRSMAWLAELPLVDGDPWQERVEMSPEDARALGLADGERVLVASAVAEVELYVQLHAGMRRGVLGIALGGGSAPAVGATAGTYRLFADSADVVSGQWLAYATRARVRKVA
jgi:anaerobic selenocysteine-containing dehydrogenase